MDRNEPIGEITLDGLKVALRKESVDRNARPESTAALTLVALRKESVDRNANLPKDRLKIATVALRKESVDRNIYDACSSCGLPSLSARRAWIEM